MLRMIVWTACLALAGCSALGFTKHVDDDLVAQVPEERMAEIREAREHYAQMRDQEAKAELAVRRAEGELDVAESELGLAKERREDRELKLEVARKTGTQAEVEQALRELAAAREEVLAAERRVVVCEKKVDRAEAWAELAEQRAELAEARLELVKAREVNRLDGPQDQKVRTEDFEEQVRKCETEVEVAQVRARAAEEDVARAEQEARPEEASDTRP